MKSHGLKRRLIRIQLTLTFLMLVMSWVLITINDYKLFKALSISNFETSSRILARNLSTCLSFKDQDECQRVLNTLKGEDSILSANVFDATDAPISEYLKSSTTTSEVRPHSIKDQHVIDIGDKKIRATFPIFDNGVLEGKLTIVAEFDLVKTFLKRQAILFSLTMLGCVILGIILSTHFQKEITTQLSMILGTMDRIKREKNYGLRTADDQTLEIDEFKQLASSLDNMLEQIQSRDNSLQLRNEDLERLVEEKVQELYKEKEKIVQNAELAALGEMAGGIAHEINNPLGIIKICASSLRKMVVKDKYSKEITTECLDDIDTTVDRISKIISGLRNISRRAEAEEKVSCSFQEIFSDVMSIATMKFKSAGIELKTVFTESDAQRAFLVNRVQLSQVLVNLLNNAFDAISPLEEKWIEISMNFTDDQCILKITDSGKGIPIEIRKKMFNPFFTTKEIGKGTGIGLSISKSLIEKNGGKFFYDENSSYTRFIIELPIGVG